MKLICLETSAKTASAAVVSEGKVFGEISVTAGLTHSQTILPAMEALLKSCSMTVADADGFAVSIGPGSFTGLRIGIGAVKGLAQGSGKGCVGVSTLEALACNFSGLSYTICPVMDARCGQVYTSLFWSSGGYPKRLWEDMAISLDQLKEKLGEGVVVLASAADGKVSLMATATDGAMKAGAHAGNLIKAIAVCVGGGGGGRPNMAQAGGKNPAGIDEALAKVTEVLEDQMK